MSYLQDHEDLPGMMCLETVSRRPMTEADFRALCATLTPPEDLDLSEYTQSIDDARYAGQGALDAWLNPEWDDADDGSADGLIRSYLTDGIRDLYGDLTEQHARVGMWLEGMRPVIEQLAAVEYMTLPPTPPEVLEARSAYAAEQAEQARLRSLPPTPAPAAPPRREQPLSEHTIRGCAVTRLVQMASIAVGPQLDGTPAALPAALLAAISGAHAWRGTAELVLEVAGSALGLRPGPTVGSLYGLPVAQLEAAGHLAAGLLKATAEGEDAVAGWLEAYL